MKLLHLAGRVVLAVLALGAFVIGFAYARTEWLATQRVSLPAVAALTIPLDSATVARGAHLASAVGGCTHCHGSDLGGDTIVNEPLIMRLTAPNLTTGKGGVLPRYENAALDAAIRHGVSPDGRMLIFMPSHEYAGLADDDITAIIAYLRTHRGAGGDRASGQTAVHIRPPAAVSVSADQSQPPATGCGAARDDSGAREISGARLRRMSRRQPERRHNSWRTAGLACRRQHHTSRHRDVVRRRLHSRHASRPAPGRHRDQHGHALETVQRHDR
jgi:cytochrome c553